MPQEKYLRVFSVYLHYKENMVPVTWYLAYKHMPYICVYDYYSRKLPTFCILRRGRVEGDLVPASRVRIQKVLSNRNSIQVVIRCLG